MINIFLLYKVFTEGWRLASPNAIIKKKILLAVSTMNVLFYPVDCLEKLSFAVILANSAAKEPLLVEQSL